MMQAAGAALAIAPYRWLDAQLCPHGSELGLDVCWHLGPSLAPNAHRSPQQIFDARPLLSLERGVLPQKENPKYTCLSA